jgi:hypothetical protein
LATKGKLTRRVRKPVYGVRVIYPIRVFIVFVIFILRIELDVGVFNGVLVRVGEVPIDELAESGELADESGDAQEEEDDGGGGDAPAVVTALEQCDQHPNHVE